MDQTTLIVDMQIPTIDKINKMHEKYTVIVFVLLRVISIPILIHIIAQGYC